MSSSSGSQPTASAFPVMPVQAGTPMGGFGSQHVYAFDGWEVGYITPGSGGELAVGETLAEAVEAAIAASDADVD